MTQLPDPKHSLTPRQWLALHPLVPVAFWLVIGLTAGRYAAVSIAAWLTTLAVFLLAYFLCECIQRRVTAYAAQAAIAAAILCFGAALYTLYDRQIEPDNIAHWLKDEPTLVTLRGRISSAPRPTEMENTGIPLPPQHFATMAVESIATSEAWRPACGNATLRLPADIPLQLGDRIELCGFGQRPSPPRYPGGYDYRAYLASADIHATLWARDSLQVRKLDDAPRASQRPSDWLEHFRLAARAKIQSYIDPADAQAGDALQALVLGYRTPAMRPVTQAFADAGVAHLLAISGSHIVLVAGVVWLVLHPFARRPRWRVLLMLAIVWCYVAATPANPPILRAAITLSFFALATLSARPMQTLNIIAASLILCLLIAPTDITDAGLQLSFAAAAGLLILAPRLHDVLIRPWAEHHAAIARAIGTQRATWWFKIRYGILLALLANFIGSMISAPLVAYHFCQFNPLATFSGVLALPIVSISLVVGLVHLLFAAMGSSLIAAPAVWCATLMNKAVFILAQIPGSSIIIRPPPIWLILILFVALIIVILRKPLRLSRASALLVLLAVLIGAAAWDPATYSQGTTLWSLGRTAVLQNQDGVIVVNPGSSSFARGQLDPFLRQQGISHVDAMILTQSNPARASGVLEIGRRFGPSIALVSQQSYAARHVHWTYDLLLKQIAAAQCRPIPMAAGDSLTLNTAHITTLWPPRREDLFFKESQAPLMIRITTGDGTLEVLPADLPDAWPMSPDAQSELSAAGIILSAGEKEPAPGIPTICRDDSFGAYVLRAGKLIPLIAPTSRLGQ